MTRRGVAVFSLVCSAAIMVSCSRAQTSDRGSTPGQQIFSTTRVLDVSIELDPDDWYALRRQGRTFGALGEGCADGPAPSPYTDFMGMVDIDGERLQRVGVRKKGFFGSLRVSHPSLKIRFNEYVERQHLYGLRRLTLNNDLQDPSHIKQCLAYRFFSDASVATPLCGFAHVRVNGEDLGIYTALETYDRGMLARNFPDDSGKLYEGQLSDFRPNWIETFETKTQKGVDERHELHELARALRAEDDELVERLEPLLDMENFLSFWAAESLMAHWDGYNGNQNNFFLYLEPTSEKFYFIPWGTDGIMGLNPFLGRPSPISVNAFGTLSYRLYGIAEMRARYFARLEALLETVWDEEAILTDIDGFETLLSPYADETELDSVREFVRERRSAIKEELARGEPIWDFPPKPDERCLQTLPELSASFTTSFGTLGEGNPFEKGEASLHIALDGEVQTFKAQTAISGIGEFRKQPVVNILGLRDDGSMIVLTLLFEDFGFEAGTPVFHGFSTFGIVSEVVDGNSRRLGYVSDGSLFLEAARMEEGALVKGGVTSRWFTRADLH